MLGEFKVVRINFTYVLPDIIHLILSDLHQKSAFETWSDLMVSPTNVI